jgi:hypothetical protein
MAHLSNGMWVPDSTARQYRDMRGEQAAELGEMLEAGVAGVLDDWNRVLKQIDPDLQLVKAKENANTPGLKPGYYHVLRRNPLGSPTVLVHEGPDGEFLDPDSSLLEMLRRGDLWSDEALRDREARLRELERQRDRRRELERQERRDEVEDRLKAANNPGVSMTRAGSWTYRAGAPRV